MKILHLPLVGAAIVAGAVGGYLAYREVYLPATGGLGITFQGPLQGPYLMAGRAIDLLVLIAFVVAGIFAASAVIRAITE
ncbi:MAG: hypothetical protein LUQ62_04840 [Methanomicrobiales archaeon]|nr:hypothetical protein [Methanomicrobiales archaeon]